MRFAYSALRFGGAPSPSIRPPGRALGANGVWCWSCRKSPLTLALSPLRRERERSYFAAAFLRRLCICKFTISTAPENAMAK